MQIAMDKIKIRQDDDEDKLIIRPVDKEGGRPDEKKGIEITVRKSSGSQPARPNRDFEKYICMKCHYKFTRKVGSNIALRCPYCSSTDIEQDTFDINRAIKESG